MLSETSLATLHQNNRDGSGTYSWSICMRLRNNSQRISVRTNQPCYGEMRKYKSTHDDCTQPEDHKPGDLHHPFPKGTPIGLAISFAAITGQYGMIYHGLDQDKSHKEFGGLLRLLYSDDSPFRRGIPKSENIELTFDDRNVVVGVVFKDCEFDPTVCVNLHKNLVSYQRDMISLVHKLIENGFEQNQALAFWYFLRGNPFSRDGIFDASNYSVATKSNLSKFLSGDSNDLTGGTLKDRFDYNRKQMANVFYDAENGKSFAQTLKTYYTPKKFVNPIPDYSDPDFNYKKFSAFCAAAREEHAEKEFPGFVEAAKKMFEGLPSRSTNDLTVKAEEAA